MTFSVAANYGFSGRRSVVMTPRAAVASSQPLATEAGVRVLRQGGTAADAAVAVAAALQVTKPCMTGLGGDAFFLYYDSATRTVHAYNGSGRSPAALTLEAALAAAAAAAGAAQDGVPRAPALPDLHPLTVTVPGAADAWVALHDRFGVLGRGEVLEPAIALAQDGFPVAPMTALWWAAGAEHQLSAHEHGHELMIDGRGPRAGEIFRNPGLARVLETLAAEGSEPFYRGWIAERVVAAVQAAGGVLCEEDLARHAGEWVEPISVAYHGYRVYECPPNGQGLAALLALQTFRELPPEILAPGREEDQLHAKVEAMRLGFADAARHVADPSQAPAPLDQLLSPEYAARRAREINPGRRLDHAGAGYVSPGRPGDDTVYFCVVDDRGNGCSFINSNYMGFGTGIVPAGCGFSIQNRGRGFVLEAGHPNVLAPRKRPYHTIIPGLITEDAPPARPGPTTDGDPRSRRGPGRPGTAGGELAAVFGVMGGMMQPQGHLQVVTSLIDDRLDPQSALDAPRFQLQNGEPDGAVLVEESMDERLRAGLERRGHSTSVVGGARRSVFGLGQIIARCEGAWWSGSDPRGDGHAAGY